MSICSLAEKSGEIKRRSIPCNPFKLHRHWNPRVARVAGLCHSLRAVTNKCMSLIVGNPQNGVLLFWLRFKAIPKSPTLRKAQSANLGSLLPTHFPERASEPLLRRSGQSARGCGPMDPTPSSKDRCMMVKRGGGGVGGSGMDLDLPMYCQDIISDVQHCLHFFSARFVAGGTTFRDSELQYKMP